MTSPINTLAQWEIWRLEINVLAAILAGGVVGLAFLLYALGVPMVVGISVGAVFLAAVFVYALWMLFEAVFLPDRAVDRAFARAEAEQRYQQENYGPGWERRRLEADMAEWRRTGQTDKVERQLAWMRAHPDHYA